MQRILKGPWPAWAHYTECATDNWRNTRISLSGEQVSGLKSESKVFRNKVHVHHRSEQALQDKGCRQHKHFNQISRGEREKLVMFEPMYKLHNIDWSITIK